MKTILSFLKPVRKGLDWIRQGLVMFWRVYKVDLFPTEKSVLLSFWYSYVHFKARRAGATVYAFLDDHVVYSKQVLENPDNSSKKRQLYRDLLDALHHPRLREIFIDFLESSPPEDHYPPVLEAMKRAWRDDGQQIPSPGETQEMKEPEQPDVPLAGLEAGQASEESKEDDPPGDPPDDAPGLHAKAYYIAAELHFELAGQQAEYQVLCRQLPELAAFVQEKFAVARLPGRFKKFKGYSYKAALKDRNAAKKGQLKPLFRQIAGNPRVFGEAIAARAREILAEHFN
jgi:hypothetical protein